ncbi:sensor histidine kinase [Candidatus Liberibacter americanus]|uniref:histidine kinase n=1 Tax=Candidatus Liberibacter americanus str. Sao Paulo TaxID=1261131 RepID=U6B4S3_9HYPH|nr:HAMP domain-containing sensor histidine kinase [Candidatus Liberibacter americanus]AHA27623.1 Signal transduction histidine kinase [Candidatus Liberibacter americanus str. Sao Paulo]EMS36332.1 putative two-component sensor histidine kinase transcriptional regulatory protein [Candidatus Liberibacter americanus PW_SP]
MSNNKKIVDPLDRFQSKITNNRVIPIGDDIGIKNLSDDDFDRKIIDLHVGSMLRISSILPLFVLFIANVGTWFTHNPMLPMWALFTLVIYAANMFLGKKVLSKNIKPGETRIWRMRLLVGQIAIGICWMLLTFVECGDWTPEYLTIYKSATLLIALSISALSNFMLPYSVFLSFLPVLVALSSQAIASMHLLDISLAAVLGIALSAFTYITHHLFKSNMQIISCQAEKDDLIAELEIAKALSDETRKRAEEANLAKSRFLASMSHELRTPLNAILGFSEVMVLETMGPLNNNIYKEYVGDIHSSGQHLLNLINEILDLSRIEAGRYELSETSVSLINIVNECIVMLQLRAQCKNIQILQQIDSTLSYIWADEKGMRQVVLNLLSNAVKFTYPGGKVYVKVSWTPEGGQYISIRDNGPGISEGEIPIALSAFGQGSIAIKSAEQGAGLGLPIVKSILSNHGGKFVIKSKLSEGVEVIAVLPKNRVLDMVPSFSNNKHNDPQNKIYA